MKREDVVVALEAIVEPVSLYEPVFFPTAVIPFISWIRSEMETMETGWKKSP